MYQQMICGREAAQIQNTKQLLVWQRSRLVKLCRGCSIEKSKLKIAGCLTQKLALGMIIAVVISYGTTD
ncbi:MAG: hypothetical protein K2N34_09310 [Lachnospiraceae bacterium]|nr:hypothetical protein [Lachnospiraceae bacterium]